MGASDGSASQGPARVVGVDVGSVRANFAWAGLDLPSRQPVGTGGRDPEGAAGAVRDAIRAGLPVALGLEAPLMIPVGATDLPTGWETLGRARSGEVDGRRSRPWSAGAGSGALATGLAQLAWILERIGRDCPGLVCTTRPEAWLSGDATLLVWEAFVSGDGKPVATGVTQHAADAAAAAETFADRFEAGTLDSSDVVCAPSSSFNLVAAASAYAGLATPGSELRQPVPVYRTSLAVG